MGRRKYLLPKRAQNPGAPAASQTPVPMTGPRDPEGGEARPPRDTALWGLKVQVSGQQNPDCTERVQCAGGIRALAGLLFRTHPGTGPNPQSCLPQGETESQEITGPLLKGSYQFFNAGPQRQPQPHAGPGAERGGVGSGQQTSGRGKRNQAVGTSGWSRELVGVSGVSP